MIYGIAEINMHGECGKLQNNFNKFNDLELFEIYVGLIQLLNYQETLAQVNNNIIDRKLDEQNTIYLSNILKNQNIIIEQNNEILKKLDNIHKL